jgi:hypothetical protein
MLSRNLKTWRAVMEYLSIIRSYMKILDGLDAWAMATDSWKDVGITV